MLFPKRVWVGLADESVSVTFRYWKRPTVKGGGTLHSAVGELAIDSVDRMAIRAITQNRGPWVAHRRPDGVC